MTAILLLFVLNIFNTSDNVLFVLDESFVVTKSEHAKWKDGVISFDILKVSDSRCPVNTNCIWAGELSVEIKVREKDEITTHTLVVPAIGTDSSRSKIKIGDFTLEFLGEPQNKSNKGIDSEENPIKLEFLFTRTVISNN